MPKLTRRTSVIGMTAASVAANIAAAPSRAMAALAKTRKGPVPTEKPYPVALKASRKTVVGYGSEATVRPGETISFHVSTYAPGDYRASLVRVINGDSLSGVGRFKVEAVPSSFAGAHPGGEQKIWSGSYVHFDTSPPAAKTSFSVVALIRPVMPGKGAQFVASQWDETHKAGWAIGVDERGEGALWIGDGAAVTKLRTTRFIQPGHWTMLGASFDATTGEWRVYDRLLTDPNFPLNDPGDRLHYIFGNRRLAADWMPAAGTPLRFAAGCGPAMANGKPAPVALYTGRIDGVRMAAGALSPEDMSRLALAATPQEVSDIAVQGFWDFSRGIDTDLVRDAGAGGFDGRCVNWPQRAMKGYRWKDGTDWRKQPAQFSAIHFREDDLLDAEWPASFRYTVPGNLRSGIYAVHLEHGGSEHYIPFFVAPPKGKATAAIAFLVPTTTYLAYNNWTRNFTQLERYPSFHVNADDIDFLLQHPEFGRSLYDQYIDGSQVVHSSWRRPSLTITLKSWLHLITADSQIAEWLEHADMPYDVITDDLLHKEGAGLLSRYRTVITGQHPEYESPEIFAAFDSFLGRGGRVIYMGGNGFFGLAAWRSDVPAVELRRASETYWTTQNYQGERRFVLNGADPAEFDAKWCARALGLRYCATTFGSGNTYYRVLPDARNARAAFIFKGVESEIIGDYGTHSGGAAGDEVDRFDPASGTPSHALHLAKSEGAPIPSWAKGEVAQDIATSYDEKNYASLVFFETPSGGAVFSVGSMAYCGALNHNNFDNDVARLTTNVLRRFDDPAPFHMPKT